MDLHHGIILSPPLCLHALALNYLDLLFSQPVKLVDQGVYLVVCGLYLALEGCKGQVRNVKPCDIYAT